MRCVGATLNRHLLRHPQITNQLLKAREQAGGAADDVADDEDEGDEQRCESEPADAVAKSTQVHKTNHKAWVRLQVLVEEYSTERGAAVSGSFALLDDDEAAGAGIACVTPAAHTKDVPKKIRKALCFKQRV